MKIAFAVSGNDLSSTIDDKFGRAPRFLIYDTDSRNFRIIPNAALTEGHGAGIRAAETVIKAGAEAVVAGECGPKATDVLTKAGVKIYPTKSADVRHALALYFHEAA
jgi:predicted Fe-Mo cluster-binding NifX family protein